MTSPSPPRVQYLWLLRKMLPLWTFRSSKGTGQLLLRVVHVGQRRLCTSSRLLMSLLCDRPRQHPPVVRSSSCSTRIGPLKNHKLRTHLSPVGLLTHRAVMLVFWLAMMCSARNIMRLLWFCADEAHALASADVPIHVCAPDAATFGGDPVS